MEDLLSRPLTEKQMRRQMDANGCVEGTVAVDLEEMIEGDRDAFLRHLSELLTGSPDLDHIEYELVGCDPDTLHIHVTGDASTILEEALEEEEEEEEEEGYE